MTGKRNRALRAAGLSTFFLLAWNPLGAPAGAQDPPVRPVGPAWLASKPRPRKGDHVELPEPGPGLRVTAMGQAAGINVVSSNMPEVLVTLRTAQPHDPGRWAP